MTPPTQESTRPGTGPWRGPTPPGGFVPFPDAGTEASVFARFEEVARLRADAVALRSPAGAWTYRDLHEAVRRRAAGLAEGRDGPTPVAVLAAHDGPLVVTMLAVVASGRPLVVLDPQAPDAQSVAVLEACRPEVILHDDAHGEQARRLAASCVCGPKPVVLDAVEGDPDRTLPRRDPWDPLMLAFTSGTSGGPKGAVITNGVIMNLVRGATNALGIGPDDVMPMLFPVSLAVAAYPMFLPLLNGGTLTTLDVRSEGLAPVGEFLEREHVTLAYLAPTLVRFLVGSLDGRTFPDLRLVALGGEVVDPDVVRLADELFSPRLVANGYGTTETGVITLYVCAPSEVVGAQMPSGYAVPDVAITVVDDAGRPVAPGAAGEIVVRGRHLFSGYWGHPELNRQVLEAHEDGTTSYRTGDHGRIDPETGALTVLGRLDTKVKVRGRFVVLGDLEAALNELDDVRAAAVVATERGGNTELVAYVVPGVAGLSAADLRARLLVDREAYAVPGRWVMLDELPTLPNGKVDRRSLPDPDVVSGVGPALQHVAAPDEHDELRQVVRELWERLLPVGTVGPDEDFMALGGDSLLAAQMLVMLEHETGVAVPMGELVAARTVRDLAEVVHRIRRAGGPVSTVARLARGDESRPLLWFVPDLQGSAYRVRHLARHLGADQPLWSFESPLLMGEPNDYGSLPVFVARLLRDLRAVQPEGPYWLAGYSFGGICAYEMARQLVQDGDEVRFLAVVDVGPGYRGPGWSSRRSPFRPWFGVPYPPPEGASARQRWAHYTAMARHNPKGAARHAMVRSGLYRPVDAARYRLDLRRHGRVRPEWRLWYAWEEHWRLAATAWRRTSTYPGRVDLFWASDSASADSTMGWGPLVGELHIHRFAGDHDSLLEPSCAPSLAAALRAALDAAIEERHG